MTSYSTAPDASTDHLGHWWLPGNQDEPVPGILRVEASGASTLTLIGALYPFKQLGTMITGDGDARIEFSLESRRKRSQIGVVHGQVGTEAFSLLECVAVSDQDNLIGGPRTARQIVAVGAFIRGAYFDPGEAMEFARINFHMDELTQWVMSTGLHEKVRYRVDESENITGGDGMTLDAELLDAMIFSAGPALTGEIRHVLKPFGDRIERRGIEQEFYLSVDGPGLTPLSDLLRQCEDFQNLLFIATGSVAAVRKITLEHPEVSREVSGKTRMIPMSYHLQWRPSRPKNYAATPAHAMLFTLPDIGGLGGLSRWMGAVADQRTVVSRVVASMLERGTMYTSDRVFNCAAALEGYDKSLHPRSVRFRTRLNRCAAKAGEPFQNLVGDVDSWCGMLTSQRNAVAHHQDFGQTVLESALASSAYWLAVFCLLRDTSAPEEVYERIVSHTIFQNIKHNVAAVMDAS